MIAIIRAEATKLLRRPALAAAAVGAVLFAVVTSLAVFLSADAGPRAGRAPTIASLAEQGGGTEAFALGISFAGLLVLVVFVANVTGEFSRGTFRSLLMREPRRLRLVAGKMAALLGFTAALLAAAAALTWIASLALAPSQGVSTSEWLTLGALGDNLADYGTALVTVGAWALLGMALGVVLRSTPLALGVGVAWAGPFEHITEDAWGSADAWFPGLLLEDLAAGGTGDVSSSQALLTLAVYVGLAAAAAAVVLRRRDVTAERACPNGRSQPARRPAVHLRLEGEQPAHPSLDRGVRRDERGQREPRSGRGHHQQRVKQLHLPEVAARDEGHLLGEPHQRRGQHGRRAGEERGAPVGGVLARLGQRAHGRQRDGVRERGDGDRDDEDDSQHRHAQRGHLSGHLDRPVRVVVRHAVPARRPDGQQRRRPEGAGSAHHHGVAVLQVGDLVGHHGLELARLQGVEQPAGHAEGRP